MAVITKDGERGAGLILIDGQLPTATLPPIDTGDVANLSVIPGASLTQALDWLAYSAADFVLSGSAAFTATVWQSIGTYSPVEGEAGAMNILNGLLYRGAAADVTTSQISYRVSYYRRTGAAPVLTLGAAGIQGSIASTQFRTQVVGNDISLEVNVGVTDTIVWRVPVLVEKVVL